MIITSVIIILREALEAALIISILLAFSRYSKLPITWLWKAIALGTIGSYLLANILPWLSEIGEGVAQDILFATIHFVVVAVLGLVVWIWSNPSQTHFLPHLMLFAITLAVLREGCEIIIYYTGFMNNTDLLMNVSVGGIIGLAIGVSVGAICYYLLLSLRNGHFIPVTFILLGLISAGLVSQAITLLYQADILSSNGALWDSSALIRESSLIGQLLYAVMGYESTPSALQVCSYFCIAGIFLFLAARIKKQPDN
ncbi:FTR1 family protein [Aurantivibrio plasticivorans]